MQHLAFLPLAVTAGFPWMNLVWVILGITLFVLAVAAVGRWSSVTHPDPEPRVRPVAEPPARPVASPAPTVDGIPTEVIAAIAAAVHMTLGARAKVTSVELQPGQPISVENLMLVWSLEGRRQIYTSHKVR